MHITWLMVNNFFERLRDRFKNNRSLLCVGLDPHEYLAKTPYDAEAFCLDIIDKTKDLALCYKINSAFFEIYGPHGIAAMHRIANHLQYQEIPFILDTKRSDIGSTAEAYARAIFETCGADATTVNPLMGHDSVKPFTDYEHKGTFILCKTSNPGSEDFLNDIYHKIIEFSKRIDQHDNIGLVVSGNHPEHFREIREKYDGWLLVPGIGHQGGKIENILEHVKDKKNPRIIISISRSLYRGDTRTTAKEFVSRVNRILT